MNKKGFVIIETIVTVVVLTTSLLYLYNSYSTIINREEARLNYDDLSYVYRTNYIRNFLENNTNINDIKRYSFSDSYTVTIGPSFNSMFTAEQRAQNMQLSLENIFTNFNVNQMILLDSQILEDCDIGYDGDSLKCKNSIENLSYNMQNYIRSLNDTSYDYYLVIEYSQNSESGRITKCIPGIGANCNSYYASLGI
ncbi:MAG TPA: hypothetical protein IAB40_05315 [Candidatus Onthocola stercoravium]|nr:hypothetical protein [Candidatus Onthocola stercoravium]